MNLSSKKKNMTGGESSEKGIDHPELTINVLSQTVSPKSLPSGLRSKPKTDKSVNQQDKMLLLKSNFLSPQGS